MPSIEEREEFERKPYNLLSLPIFVAKIACVKYNSVLKLQKRKENGSHIRKLDRVK